MMMMKMVIFIMLSGDDCDEDGDDDEEEDKNNDNEYENDLQRKLKWHQTNLFSIFCLRSRNTVIRGGIIITALLSVFPVKKNIYKITKVNRPQVITGLKSSPTNLTLFSLTPA